MRVMLRDRNSTAGVCVLSENVKTILRMILRVPAGTQWQIIYLHLLVFGKKSENAKIRLIFGVYFFIM